MRAVGICRRCEELRGHERNHEIFKRESAERAAEKRSERCRMGWITRQLQQNRLEASGTMTRNQTRKSISIRGDTYGKLQDHCRALGVSMSGWLEETIAIRVQQERDRYGEANDPRGTKARGV